MRRILIVLLMLTAGVAHARILHVGDNTIKLSQTKTTTPALHVRVGDEVWYGAMYPFKSVNTLHVNYNNVNFVINKKVLVIGDLDNVTLVYGANDTIVLKGSVDSVLVGKNYTGNVTVVLGANTPVVGSVFDNGTFIVNLNVKLLDANVYGLNVTINGNENYSSVNRFYNDTDEIIDKINAEAKTEEEKTVLKKCGEQILDCYQRELERNYKRIDRNKVLCGFSRGKKRRI